MSPYEIARKILVQFARLLTIKIPFDGKQIPIGAFVIFAFLFTYILIPLIGVLVNSKGYLQDYKNDDEFEGNLKEYTKMRNQLNYSDRKSKLRNRIRGKKK